MESIFEFIRASWYALDSAFSYIPGSELVKNYIRDSYRNDPFRIFLESLLVIFTIRYLTSKKYKLDGSFIPLTKKEINDLIDDWDPEPLAQPLTQLPAFAQFNVVNIPEIVGPVGLHVKLAGGQDLLNISSFNFLGTANSDLLKVNAIQTIRSYGVGTCGPPGFYGTLDVHLKLESKIASFIGANSAIIYSQAFSAVSSVIPAFAKRGDILVVDKGVHFAIQKGIQISRSHVHYFEHNDMDDLERVLLDIQKQCEKKPITRRFIIVEGLYINHGDLCPLPKLVELKERFKYRLLCDESLSIGSVGSRGAGVADFYSLPISKVDIITGSFANGFGACGGFCAGEVPVVDHQRLSGQAYCFSASLPALLAVTALTSITYLESHPEIMSKLQSNCQFLHKLLLSKLSSYFNINHSKKQTSSSFWSPVIHLSLKGFYQSRDEASMKLQAISEECLKKGLLITRSKYVESQESFLDLLCPSLRLNVSAAFSESDMKFIVNQLQHAAVALRL